MEVARLYVCRHRRLCRPIDRLARMRPAASFLRISRSPASHFCLAKMKTTAASPSPLPLIPPPPRGHDKNHWKLISQGAEARLWLVDNYLTTVGGTRNSGSSTSSSSTSRAAICKERFAKSYRHPTLDVRLTKSRTKAEARCLTRCRKAGVRCPAVLGVELAVPADDAGPGTSTNTVTLASGSDAIISASESNDGKNADQQVHSNTSNQRSATTTTSSCIYLEHIEGCTVREYLEKRAGSGSAEDEADFIPDRDSDDEKEDTNGRQDGPNKRPKLVPSGCTGTSSSDGTSNPNNSKTKMTRVDDDAMKVAKEVGILVADMHNSNIVHGDLTTSNIMMRNPPSLTPSADVHVTTSSKDWMPRLVLIDFGLAGTAGNKGVSHEERAVDLYVLERAFEATHPGSKALVEEALRAYKGRCKTCDSVFQRLAQVRMRGRKRECFG